MKPMTFLRGLWVACALLVAACGDNHEQPRPPADASIDAPVPNAQGPCLDQPTDLPQPPTGALPCELLPPDFVATE
jgi:hypothetical protein